MMDANDLKYQLTDEERQQFDQAGYFVVENAIPQDLVTKLTTALDRIDAEERAANGLGLNDRQNILDFIGRDDIFSRIA